MKRFTIPLLLLSVIFAGCTTNTTPNEPKASLDSHVHGLAIDRSDSNRLYIATHTGLFTLTNDANLTLVGNATDDYMGFSLHPTDSKTFFSSGHPSSHGGNLGVQKSTDSGLTWKKISNGDSDGPVDFHTMTVSEANPALLFGWYGGYIYRSEDSGIVWRALPEQLLVSSLATDSKDEKIIYAGTRGGLLKSSDKGETWKMAFEFTPPEDVVLDVEVDAKNEIWLATAQGKILRSFEKVGTLPEGAVATHLAIDQKNPAILYAASGNNIYKSSDAGKSWGKVI